MATTTTNYGLTKPASTDYYNIDVANANNDKIDTTLKAHEDGIGKKLDSSGSANELTATFTAASTRTLPVTGETLGVILGKILKWLSDLGTAALCSAEAFASASHKHAASDISSGTLSTARGGTGVTGLSTTPTSGSAAPITSDGVFAALEALPQTVVISGDATLSTSAWTGSAAPYSCALSISGVLATDTPIVWRVGTGDASADAITAAAWALCCEPGYEPDTAAGTLTIHASAVPTSNIPIHYEIVRGG